MRLNPAAGAETTDTVVFPSRSSDGPSSRFFFDPITPALRGGRVQSDQWDVTNRGADSVAFGLDTVASGRSSAAMGTASTASHDGSFVWSDQTMTAASTQADEVTFGALGGFRVLGNGAGTPAYVPGDIYLDAQNVTCTGKLTVTGLIDPTGLVLTKQTSVPGGQPAPGSSTIWVRNDDTPMFSNSSGYTTIVVTTTDPAGIANVSDGGTGLTTYNTGDTLYASAPDTLAALPIGTLGQVLTVSGGLPVWAASVCSQW